MDRANVSGCCGVDYLYGVDVPKSRFAEIMESTFESPTKDSLRHGWRSFDHERNFINSGGSRDSYYKNKSYFPEAGPGMYLLFLDVNQETAFKDILEKYEFNRIAGPFRNPRMKNVTKVVIYARINTFEWYSQFIPEDIQHIWKKPIEQ